MSVGQGKSLRAHQHKFVSMISKTRSKVMGIKERVEAEKLRIAERMQRHRAAAVRNPIEGEAE